MRRARWPVACLEESSMTTSHRRFAGAGALAAALAAAAALPGCAARFADTLQGVDKATLPHQTFTMTAEKYDFDPEELHVQAGSLVTLTITALDDVHGF